MCVSVCASILAADIAKARHILHTFAIHGDVRGHVFAVGRAGRMCERVCVSVACNQIKSCTQQAIAFRGIKM